MTFGSSYREVRNTGGSRNRDFSVALGLAEKIHSRIMNYRSVILC